MKVSAPAYELTGPRARSQCVEGNLVQGQISSGRNWDDGGELGHGGGGVVDSKGFRRG